MPSLVVLYVRLQGNFRVQFPVSSWGSIMAYRQGLTCFEGPTVILSDAASSLKQVHTQVQG